MMGTWISKLKVLSEHPVKPPLILLLVSFYWHLMPFSGAGNIDTLNHWITDKVRFSKRKFATDCELRWKFHCFGIGKHRRISVKTNSTFHNSSSAQLCWKWSIWLIKKMETLTGGLWRTPSNSLLSCFLITLVSTPTRKLSTYCGIVHLEQALYWQRTGIFLAMWCQTRTSIVA